MKRLFFLILIFICSLISIRAQDFLVPPASNPALFPKGNFFENKEKLFVQEDRFVYEFDTLSLPFVDDFSTNHLPPRILNDSHPGLRDTTVYAIFINGNIYRAPEGFTRDTSFLFSISRFDSSIVQQQERLPFIIELHDISKFPTQSETLTVYEPFDIFDTLNGGVDTVFKTPEFFADSMTYFLTKADSNVFYTDADVLLNNTFAIEPPSIGVATFDGLSEFGIPYDFFQTAKVQADFLSSVPIDLSNLPDTQVYISFQFQPQGRSIDNPESGDSLALDFFNVNTGGWSTFWRSPGVRLDTFRNVILKVPNNFHRKGFRFRFRNFASSVGAFDHWHLDYIYLDHGRNASDTIFKDLAYVYDAPSTLADFMAMPWFHFRTNPDLYLRDTLPTLVVNNSDQNLPVVNKVVIFDTTTNTIAYQFPTSDQFVGFPPKVRVNFRYPLDFTYPINQINGPGTFEAVYDVDFRPNPIQEQDFIRSNDTVIGKTVLEDYYAYDDGTAEAGYGVEPRLGPDGLVSFVALEFNIPFEDTIGGVQLYFLPQTNDVRKQSFELMVWSSLNPPNLIFSMPMQFNPIYTDDNAFLNYWFDSLITVGQTFYVGLKSIGENSLNIGYDLNTNSREKLFWSFDGQSFNNPSAGIRDGSLMLRPIFRETRFGVGMDELLLKQQSIVLYPNPAKDYIQLEGLDRQDVEQLQIYDLRGRLIRKSSFRNEIDLSDLDHGMYILRLISRKGNAISKKFVVSP